MSNIILKNRLLYLIFHEDIQKCEEYLQNNKIDLNVILHNEDELSHINGHSYLTLVVSKFIKEEINPYIDLLIKYGADVNFKNISGTTPLIWAGAGTIPIIKKLLEYGANIDDQNEDGETVLLVATYFDNVDNVKYLISQNANLLLKNTAGDDLIKMAMNTDNSELEVHKFLCQYDVQVDLLNKYPILYKSFINTNTLHPDINKKFDYLNVSDHLGLI